MRYSLANGSSGSKPLGMSTTTALDILTEARCTAKKQGGLVDLGMLITEDTKDLRVISLWETGGDHGISSIIMGAYAKPNIFQCFESCAWLKLIPPFNPHEFIRSLVHQFYVNSLKKHEPEESQRVDDVLDWDSLQCGRDNTAVWAPLAAGAIGSDPTAACGTAADTGMEGAQRTHLVNEFVRLLKNTRYLVVIEGLSNMEEWHAIRTYLPDGKNRSRIVVSTPHLEIARLCAGKNHQVLELKKSPDNHSVYAFFHEVYIFGYIFWSNLKQNLLLYRLMI
jgi:hypothetical protein